MAWHAMAQHDMPLQAEECLAENSQAFPPRGACAPCVGQHDEFGRAAAIYRCSPQGARPRQLAADRAELRPEERGGYPYPSE